MKRLLLALLLVCAATARAQTGGERLHVYLITFGPGDAVWERFGHNAIAIEDDGLGSSVAYNWGMFSFEQPGFVRRFLQGRMLYWMAGYDTDAFIQQYVEQNRDIYAQELNLTPAQKIALRDFLEWNALPQNRYYRYDYFRDNCSTRVRDAIDRATGGALRATLMPIETPTTYRSHTARLTYTDPLIYTGLMLAMGPAIDQPLSAWQETFIPMELRKWVRQVKVRAADGSEQPLVVSERTIFAAIDRPPLAASAPSKVLPFTIFGIVIAGVVLLLDRWSRSKRWAMILLASLVTILEFTIGFFGTLIALLWAFTDHVVTYGNENVLQANTLSLLLAVFAGASILDKIWFRRWAAWFGLFVAGLSVLGVIIQLSPGFGQHNGEIIGLLLPIHGAVAYVLWERWYARR